VLRPLRLVITNYPEGKVEEVEAVNNPEDPSMGTEPGPTVHRRRYVQIDGHGTLSSPAKGRGRSRRVSTAHTKRGKRNIRRQRQGCR